ncbi:G-protein coupled receptor 1 [Dermatophagoides farinae]|uniref:G-protein coupled receptor 1 n=1 Tax=Dermatophagoides farinae TaxID=6954 RepID=A0A922L2A1_DERFA|nr:G-protein coupled receptor 1 [Dermatophagoides farinae]
MADIINFTSSSSSSSTTFFISQSTRQHLLNISRNLALASYAAAAAASSAANVQLSSSSSSSIQLQSSSASSPVSPPLYMATTIINSNDDIDSFFGHSIDQPTVGSIMDNNNNNVNPFETLQKVVSIIVPILFAVIVIVGLVGNSLVVIVVKCNPQMYSTTNLLIINLAIADLLFIIFCVPFTAWDYAFPYWPFGSVWCKVVQYLIVVCAYASIYTLVLMSLDRYLAVAHPIRSISLRTVKNANRAILILWIFILLFCIPTFITHNVSYDNSSDEEYSYALYQVIFCLFSYVIPILLILILYILMLKRLWFSGIPGRNMSSESVRSKKKVTRMVVIVVIIFACCWCPIQIILVLRSFNVYELSTTKVIIQITGQVLVSSSDYHDDNKTINHIIYQKYKY